MMSCVVQVYTTKLSTTIVFVTAAELVLSDRTSEPGVMGVW